MASSPLRRLVCLQSLIHGLRAPLSLVNTPVCSPARLPVWLPAGAAATGIPILPDQCRLSLPRFGVGFPELKPQVSSLRKGDRLSALPLDHRCARGTPDSTQETSHLSQLLPTTAVERVPVLDHGRDVTFVCDGTHQGGAQPFSALLFRARARVVCAIFGILLRSTLRSSYGAPMPRYSLNFSRH